MNGDTMNLLALLQRAMDSKYGVRVQTNNPKKLRTDLYTVRRAQTFKIPVRLSICSDNTALFIIKENPDAEDKNEGM